jgi:hypothetical protein
MELAVVWPGAVAAVAVEVAGVCFGAAALVEVAVVCPGALVAFAGVCTGAAVAALAGAGCLTGFFGIVVVCAKVNDATASTSVPTCRAGAILEHSWIAILILLITCLPHHQKLLCRQRLPSIESFFGREERRLCYTKFACLEPQKDYLLFVFCNGAFIIPR